MYTNLENKNIQKQPQAKPNIGDVIRSKFFFVVIFNVYLCMRGETMTEARQDERSWKTTKKSSISAFKTMYIKTKLQVQTNLLKVQ